MCRHKHNQNEFEMHLRHSQVKGTLCNRRQMADRDILYATLVIQIRIQLQAEIQVQIKVQQKSKHLKGQL